MGLNGAGKSTLASVIMGHPDYEITEGSVHYDGQDLAELEIHERARAGLFLSFQYPHAISASKSVPSCGSPSPPCAVKPQRLAPSGRNSKRPWTF